MSVSVIDVYRDVLPKTNCGDCGQPTCLAFASRVVLDGDPLDGCPHIDPSVGEPVRRALEAQQAAGEGMKRDLAKDALQWALERATSMALEDMPDRIGGRVLTDDGGTVLVLPYFAGSIRVTFETIVDDAGRPLDRWEQVLVYNHLAQGGSRPPTGRWISLEEVPNSGSKVRTLHEYSEKPIAARFQGRLSRLATSARALGAAEVTADIGSADVAWRFQPLPRVPVLLLFWDEDPGEGFGARAKILFDETIPDHLDIESMVFLAETLAARLASDHRCTAP